MFDKFSFNSKWSLKSNDAALFNKGTEDTNERAPCPTYLSVSKYVRDRIGNRVRIVSALVTPLLGGLVRVSVSASSANVSMRKFQQVSSGII